jgi:hypothetical protein
LKTKTCYDHALQKLKSFHQTVVGQKQNQFRSDNPVQKLYSFHQKATQKQKIIIKKKLFIRWGDETKDKNPFFDFEAVTFFFCF